LLNRFEKLVETMTLRTAQAAQVAMVFIIYTDLKTRGFEKIVE